MWPNCQVAGAVVPHPRMPPVLETVHTKAMGESIFVKSENLYNVKNYINKSRSMWKTMQGYKLEGRLKIFRHEKRHYSFWYLKILIKNDR